MCWCLIIINAQSRKYILCVSFIFIFIEVQWERNWIWFVVFRIDLYKILLRKKRASATLYYDFESISSALIFISNALHNNLSKIIRKLGLLPKNKSFFVVSFQRCIIWCIALTTPILYFIKKLKRNLIFYEATVNYDVFKNY